VQPALVIQMMESREATGRTFSVAQGSTQPDDWVYFTLKVSIAMNGPASILFISFKLENRSFR
jgi:hypothetical protein